MRINYKHPILIALFVMAVLIGCEKADSDQPYGYSYIYIPQATSTGLNLNYAVPSGNDVNTYNYFIDSEKSLVNVHLGVLRSGLEAYDAYSVDVSTYKDTVNTIISNNLIPGTKPLVLLPDGSYTLPSQISVPSGKASATFELAIKLPDLKALAGKRAALCVQISNPSKYLLNKYRKVVVVIDVDALRLP